MKNLIFIFLLTRAHFRARRAPCQIPQKCQIWLFFRVHEGARILSARASARAKFWRAPIDTKSKTASFMYLQYVHIFKTRGAESIWSFVNVATESRFVATFQKYPEATFKLHRKTFWYANSHQKALNVCLACWVYSLACCLNETIVLYHFDFKSIEVLCDWFIFHSLQNSRKWYQFQNITDFSQIW